jgi:multidrug efflux pump subunit AcrA (membrane-fusion protein)
MIELKKAMSNSETARLARPATAKAPLAPIGISLPPVAAPSVSTRRRANVRRGMIIGPVMLVCLGLIWMVSGSKTNESAPHLTKAERGAISGSLHELGSIEALIETPVLSPFNGEVVWKIEDGTFVEAGEPVVRLDSSTMEEDLVTSRQTLQDKEANVARVEEQIEHSRKRYAHLVRQQEIALKQAELNRDDVYDYPLESDRKDGILALEAADLARKSAEVDFQSAEELYKVGFFSELTVKQKQLALTIAEVNYDKAKIVRQYQEQGSTDDQKKVAELSVSDARKTFNITTFNRDADAIVLQSTLKLNKLWRDDAARQLARKQKVYDSAAVKAPKRGRVAFIDVWKGSSTSLSPVQVGEIRAQGADLCTICDTSGLRVRVLINESDVKNVAIGQKATIKLVAFPGKVFTATVSRLALVAQDKNIALSGLAVRRSGEAFVNVVEAKLDFDNLSEADRSNMRIGFTADVTINTSEKSEALLVPWTAVSYDISGTPFVDAIAADGTIKRQTLKLGRRDNGRVEVLEGLTEGQQVLER